MFSMQIVRLTRKVTKWLIQLLVYFWVVWMWTLLQLYFCVQKIIRKNSLGPSDPATNPLLYGCHIDGCSLFTLWSDTFFFSLMHFTGEVELTQPDNILNIRYGIAGERTIGAHRPVALDSTKAEHATQNLIFRSAVVLQRPVLDPCLAVGFLPLPSASLRVGQLVTIKWRVERLKDFRENEVSTDTVSTNRFYWWLNLFISMFFSQSRF